MRQYLWRWVTLHRRWSLLIGGVAVSLGLSPLSAQMQPQVSDPQVAAMVEALRQAAPQTGKPNDGYYSQWQVKPQTLTGWSRFCLKREVTPTEFGNNSQLARQVVSCIVRRELNQQFRATKGNETATVHGVACWWMTGNYTGCNQGFTGNYVQKVTAFYTKELRSSRRSPKITNSP